MFDLYSSQCFDVLADLRWLPGRRVLRRWCFTFGLLLIALYALSAPNLAPVNTMPASFTVNEDTPGSLSGLSIADADAGAGTMTVTLSVTSGIISATTGGGVTVTRTGNALITLSGTVANINAFLASTSRPVYLPVRNSTTAVTITMVTNDNGNTGTGGALTDTDARTINVNSVQDAPVLALDPTNRITNGSFESGATGWSALDCVETNPVVNYGVPAAPHGTIVGEVECNTLSPVTTRSRIQQTISTTTGQSYVYSLMAVSRANATVNDAGALSVAGADLLTFNVLTTWTSCLTTFTATSASTIMRVFSNGSASGLYNSGDNSGLIVDDIHVHALNNYVNYTENGAIAAITATGSQIIDGDSPNMASATITLTNQQSGDRLLVNGSSAASGTVGGIPYVLSAITVTLTGSFTIAQYAAALALIQFENTLEDPNTAVVRDVTVVVNDGSVNSNTAHSYITVIAVNDAPVAANDEYATNKNVALSAQLIRANDSDVDNSTAQITWSLASGGTAAANGTLLVNANGTFDFTPNNEFLGSVSFTYNMCDNGPLCSQATVTITVVSPLPVELIRFEGRNEGSLDHLYWATATERNNDRFEVERSADAMHFEYIGSVDGAGTTVQEQHYAFDDMSPLQGVNYYRLKQVDTDGAYEYSPVIHLFVDKMHGDAAVSTMDPAGYYSVRVDAVNGGPVELWGPGGQLVRIVEVVDGRCEVDLRDDAAGIYVLRVDNAGREESFLLVRP